MNTQRTIFITGAAGYVGAMLVKHFDALDSVERIIALDKDPFPSLLDDCEKVTFLQLNTADRWQDQVATYEPDTVIHTAWQIREIYGNRELSWKWNIDGSDNVFDFCFDHPFVKNLIHFSSISSYGAFKENKMDTFFTEEDPLRESTALYAEEKRIAENHLRQKWELYHAENPALQVSILRPASITGPRGRFMRSTLGLQSALGGRLTSTFTHRLVSSMTAFVPVTTNWLRQFIHEDDVVSIVEILASRQQGGEGKCETFIISPPGEVVKGSDMARIVGKKAITLPPFLIRIVFFFAWHLSRGRVPTARGSWKGYCYPIPVDGSKLTKQTGYVYRYNGTDALQYTDGTYEYAVDPLYRLPAPTHL